MKKVLYAVGALASVWIGSYIVSQFPGTWVAAPTVFTFTAFFVGFGLAFIMEE